MSQSRRKPVKRRNLSDEQREALRQNALKLIEEGKWGGRGPADGSGATWRQGRKKRPNFVPSPEQLATILEAIESARDAGRASNMRRFWAAFPIRGLKALGLDHEDLAELASSVIDAALHRGSLPHKIVFRRDGTVDLGLDGRARRRPLSGGEKEVVLFESRPEDFASYTRHELLDVLSLLCNTFVYPVDPAHDADAFLDALFERAREEIDGAIARKEGVNVLDRTN